MTQCVKCGTTLAEGARYCGSCGVRAVDPGAATMLVPGDEQDGLLELIRRQLDGQYDVERELGRGGMAVVFRATEVELSRRVALKVLPPELALNRSIAERFKREAKMAASLDHPNIIPVYRVGQVGSLLYIAMKFIDGRGLDAVLESQGPLPVSVVLHILRGATSALAFAHERGIIHRDVKGANILVDRDGRVLVSDFGIARAIEEPTLTATGMVMGTPYYMSPEQCAARRIGPQSDQYSLGVVAFQMLTGLVPFHAETLPGIMHHHFYTPVPDIAASRTDVPPALLEVVNRALAKKPEQRYASTQAMLAAVETIPFTESDRRQAEALLRELALGAPIPPVDATTLPPLADVVRLTPPRTGAVRALIRRTATRRMAVPAGVAVIAVLATTGMVWSGRGHPESMIMDTGIRRTARATQPPDSLSSSDSTAGRAGGATEKPSLAATTLAAFTGRRQRTESTRSDTPSLPDGASPAPEPPVPAAFGKIRVRAYPADAVILIDGRPLGRGVVVDSAVAAGARQLRIVAPGYTPFDTLLTIVPNETTQLPRVTLLALENKP